MLPTQLHSVELLLLHFCSHLRSDLDHDLALHGFVLLHFQEFVGGQAAVLQLDVEDDQVHKEEDGEQVQGAHDIQHNLELCRQVGAVKVLLDRLDALRHFFCLGDVVDHKGVRHVMHEAEPEDPDNELKKVIVVLVADAVV